MYKRDGVHRTNDGVIKQAFKTKFDAKNARLRNIAEWLNVRFPLWYYTRGLPNF